MHEKANISTTQAAAINRPTTGTRCSSARPALTAGHGHRVSGKDRGGRCLDVRKAGLRTRMDHVGVAYPCWRSGPSDPAPKLVQTDSTPGQEEAIVTDVITPARITLRTGTSAITRPPS